MTAIQSQIPQKLLTKKGDEKEDCAQDRAETGKKQVRNGTHLTNYLGTIHLGFCFFCYLLFERTLTTINKI